MQPFTKRRFIVTRYHSCRKLSKIPDGHYRSRWQRWISQMWFEMIAQLLSPCSPTTSDRPRSVCYAKYRMESNMHVFCRITNSEWYIIRPCAQRYADAVLRPRCIPVNGDERRRSECGQRSRTRKTALQRRETKRTCAANAERGQHVQVRDLWVKDVWDSGNTGL